MRVLDVPVTLDYRTVESLYSQVSGDGAPGPVLFDARRLRWIDPNGMLLLLGAGKVALDRGSPPRLSLPTDGEVRGYLARMGFHRAAAHIFDPPPRGGGRRFPAGSDVLLEVTAIATNNDVHGVVDRVQERAEVILRRTLHYPRAAVVPFSVILSEVCQNIVEHAQGPGWVAAQAYNFRRRLGRWVAVIAVLDVGLGFRGSLERAQAEQFGDRWGDMAALEAAFLMGRTRHSEPGRGQGIRQIRAQVARWRGMFSIRSGTARVADPGAWSHQAAAERGLAPFPGAQINIIIPERRRGDAADKKR